MSWFPVCPFCEIVLASAGHVGGDENRIVLPWEGGADSHDLELSSRSLNSRGYGLAHPPHPCIVVLVHSPPFNHWLVLWPPWVVTEVFSCGVEWELWLWFIL